MNRPFGSYSRLTLGELAFHPITATPLHLRQTALLHGFRAHGTCSNRSRCKGAVSACSEQHGDKDTKLRQVQRLCVPLGYALEDQSVGPLVKLKLHKDAAVAATINGALLPGARLHVESFRSAAALAHRGGNDESKGLQGVSAAMCVFIGALAVAADRNAQWVYGLAIEDDVAQHRRLVKYLTRFGGRKIRRVDDSLRSVPDRIAYGGFGTIMRGDIAAMLSRGVRMLERQGWAKTGNECINKKNN